MENDKKPVYILCPRCELNYIKPSDEYCDVCKVELGLLEKNFLIQEEDLEAESGRLCPICKVNYLNEDEDICIMCQKEKDLKDRQDEAEEEDSWTYDEEDEELPPEEMEISLELTAEEEAEEEEESDDQYKEVDDFNYDVDPNDFEDYDEDEEDDEDDEDEDDE